MGGEGKNQCIHLISEVGHNPFGYLKKNLVWEGGRKGELKGDAFSQPRRRGKWIMGGRGN